MAARHAHRVGNAQAVLVLARSLSAHDETLHRLRVEFLFAAPAALLLAIIAGYGLAAASLRPVEAMRPRAAAITASTPGRRLSRPGGSRRGLAAGRDAERHAGAARGRVRALRTPLALLRTELELALRRPRTREELEQAVRSAAEETERLTRLAEDLLLIARSDQGSLPIRRERLSAGELLTDVADRFAGRAVQLGRSVSVEHSDDAILDADPGRIEQAIGNLVTLALLFAEATRQR